MLTVAIKAAFPAPLPHVTAYLTIYQTQCSEISRTSAGDEPVCLQPQRPPHASAYLRAYGSHTRKKAVGNLRGCLRPQRASGR
jgi:hypothetical protein